ncbi:MAG: hypothetical protein LBH74_09070 [Nitrososphaerota archaeon]|nr:hypothetical protein [Nitrososphaerota archaeon]
MRATIKIAELAPYLNIAVAKQTNLLQTVDWVWGGHQNNVLSFLNENQSRLFLASIATV